MGIVFKFICPVCKRLRIAQHLCTGDQTANGGLGGQHPPVECVPLSGADQDG